jgi:xanthine phosphoribosyltransferase
MSEKYIVTWDALHAHSRKLALQLLSMGKWKGIIAVSRGGLVPASLVARELCIRYLDTVCISSYNHKSRHKLKVLKRPKGDGSGFIVIDDLVDSGNTVRIVKEMYPNAFFACIFAKPSVRHLVNTYVVDVSEKTWIEQPWDMGLVYLDPLVKDIKSTD